MVQPQIWQPALWLQNDPSMTDDTTVVAADDTTVAPEAAPEEVTETEEVAAPAADAEVQA